jgi:hypothetical protein
MLKAAALLSSHFKKIYNHKPMKITLTIIMICFTLIVLGQAYVSNSTKKSETLPYKVLKKLNGFEIRNYESAVFTATTLPYTTYSEASGKGFRILAGYIFGGNEQEEKIAMTTPVTMELNDNMKMLFMVPSEKNLESLPKPNSSNVSFEVIEPRTLAAIEFGGWASDKTIEVNKQKLIKLLEENNIQHRGNFMLMAYNPPYQMANRRNEILVELDPISAADISK